MRFAGTATYIASDELTTAVNAAIALERPLLIKGEPGTGKTLLAEEIAGAIDAPLISWHIKSTTRAQQGLYEYDAVSRLRDSQLGDARVSDIRNYIKRGKLWDAFTHERRPVLLIDEIDKADIEFPNDLLLELDRMEFHVYETGETVKAERRPIVVITSNNEKELPDAFLRRCFFHYIRFPDTETMQRIVDSHFPSLKPRLIEEALRQFFAVRETPGLKKKPTTSELLDWIKLLVAEDISPEVLRERDPAKTDPAAARRAVEERAGRASVRAAGVLEPARAGVSQRLTSERSQTRCAMQISLTPEQEAWLRTHYSAIDAASLETAARKIIDDRITESELETDDLAWAKPLVDEGLAAIERGDFITLEEFKTRNAARLAALKD